MSDKSEIEILRERCVNLEIENRRLKRTLRFYADPKEYNHIHHRGLLEGNYIEHGWVLIDEGKRAREALEGTE